MFLCCPSTAPAPPHPRDRRVAGCDAGALRYEYFCEVRVRINHRSCRDDFGEFKSRELEGTRVRDPRCACPGRAGSDRSAPTGGLPRLHLAARAAGQHIACFHVRQRDCCQAVVCGRTKGLKPQSKTWVWGQLQQGRTDSPSMSMLLCLALTLDVLPTQAPAIVRGQPNQCIWPGRRGCVPAPQERGNNGAAYPICYGGRRRLRSVFAR
jgi:hypothetical protein